MKLVLVRHGETEWNKLGRFQGHSDISLNSRGIAQARETAGAVVAWKHSAVYSSTLRRTMQVAEEISQLSGMPVVGVDGFKELSLGDLEGATGQEMLVDWSEIYSTWVEDPAAVSMPNGESLRDLEDRTWNSLVELEQAHTQDEALIIVSHNFAIRAMVGKVLGMTLSNFHRLSLSLSSICVIESDQRAVG